MTLEEIKTAVDAGNPFSRNGSAIGLTSRDGTRLNGRPDEFFIEESAEVRHEVL